MNIVYENSEGKEVDLTLPNTIRVCFKSPDCVDYAVNNLGIELDAEDEIIEDEIKNEIHDMYSSKLAQWIDYGEYITVEFNVDEMTAKVVESK